MWWPHIRSTLAHSRVLSIDTTVRAIWETETFSHLWRISSTYKYIYIYICSSTPRHDRFRSQILKCYCTLVSSVSIPLWERSGKPKRSLTSDAKVIQNIRSRTLNRLSFGTSADQTFVHLTTFLKFTQILSCYSVLNWYITILYNEKVNYHLSTILDNILHRCFFCHVGNFFFLTNKKLIIILLLLLFYIIL